MSEFCIIGSGPSAIAAAVALTRRNLPVSMLDAGRSLEPSRAQTVARLAAQKPEAWEPSDVTRLKEGVEVSARGIPLKRLYGSDFPFVTEGAGKEFEYTGAGVRPSFARAGLSNVWGAGLLPFPHDDMADWPFDPAELDPCYREVLSFVPSTGSKEEELAPSQQGLGLLRDALRSKSALAEHGITVARSTLAVSGRKCVRCGLCIYGCPYGLIYNSESTLRDLRTLPNFRYQPGFVVDLLREQAGEVRIEGHDLASGARLEARARRVLLGAGVIPSTAILLSSLGEYGLRIRLQDSFYFLVPLLRFAGVRGVAEENLHTLAQAFLTMRDPDICERSIHFSIYGFNDLMIPSLRASVGPPGSMKSFYSRVMVAGGYLHSALSPGLWMTVDRQRVRLEGEDSARAIALAKKAVARLAKQAFRLRALPVAPGIRFFPPGRGYHTGGSFPMRKNPTHRTSDMEGRPFGFERVHLIDASCLPSIPASTITLPVMANSWRIANIVANS